jgi:transcriptional regulator with XRE-family HTH domain
MWLATKNDLRHYAGMAEDTSLRAIGERIRLTRVALGYPTSIGFARIVGLTQQALNNYEQGIRRPDLDKALLICRATGVTLDWLYRGDPSGLPLRLSQKILGTPEARRAS